MIDRWDRRGKWEQRHHKLRWWLFEQDWQTRMAHRRGSGPAPWLFWSAMDVGDTLLERAGCAIWGCFLFVEMDNRSVVCPRCHRLLGETYEGLAFHALRAIEDGADGPMVARTTIEEIKRRQA